MAGFTVGRRIRARRRPPLLSAPAPARRALAHHPCQTLANLRRGIGAARIELLVAPHEVRAVRAQPVHEYPAHLSAQVQRDPPDAHRAHLPRDLQDLLDLFRVVVDPGHERRYEDPGRDPGAVEPAPRREPLARMRSVRLARPPRLLLE